MKSNDLTTASGAQYAAHQDSQTVGPRGPVLLQDFVLQENLAHFVRERIPERVVNTKGCGAYGTFTVTQDISQYTRAQLFAKAGNSCRVFIRFSGMLSEKGSADSTRDTLGFAVKFYTEGGNWDLVGNNSPVFFIKDGKKFPDFIHSQKREPQTNLLDPARMWDYWSLNPESLHQVLIVMSERGLPCGFRNMHGYGAHTFSMINENNERVWVKFHLKSKQGIKNFSAKEAMQMKAENPDFAQKDLVDAIRRKDFPEWTLYIQVMTEEQAAEWRWNPFDVTKVWFHSDFPLIEVGVLQLNELPENFFAEVEQAAFSPAHLIDGISFSPDKTLQARLFAYSDAQRYRLGINANLLPVNACPFGTKTYHRDGFMAKNEHGNQPNYFPNSFSNTASKSNFQEFEYDLNSKHVAAFSRNEDDNDHYTQPGLFYTKALQTDEQRDILVENIVTHMRGIQGDRKEEIINRQLCHFFRANIEMGMKIAAGLQVKIDAQMMNHSL